MLPRRGAREQEVGHVHAGDEKHESDRTQQDEENRAHIAYHFVF